MRRAVPGRFMRYPGAYSSRIASLLHGARTSPRTKAMKTRRARARRVLM